MRPMVLLVFLTSMLVSPVVDAKSNCGNACIQHCMRQVVPARAHQYLSIAFEAANAYALPIELLMAVMRTESNYYPTALSNKGAIGLMQIMPSTGKYLKIDNIRDPRQNIFGAAKYIRRLANKTGLDMILVLAGYHAGLGAVRKYGGVPRYESTRKYVRAVSRRYLEFRKHVVKCSRNSSHAIGSS